VGKGGVSVNYLDSNMLEGAMIALSKRIACLEKKLETNYGHGEAIDEQQAIKNALLKDPNQKLPPEFESVLASKLIPICDRIAQIEAQMPKKTTLPIEQAAYPKVEVPKDLRLFVGKKGKKGNRSSEIVQRRWAIWKIQSEAGIPFNVIAKAWDCDHSAIYHARENGWSSYKNRNGKAKI